MCQHLTELLAVTVHQAVGELFEEFIAGQVLHNHPFAHGQRLSCGGSNNVRSAGV